MRDLTTGRLTIKLPDGLNIEPYGEVIAVGPDCKIVKVGDFVMFVPQAYIAGFDQGADERFIISEGSVFAFVDPNMSQEGVVEPKIVKNSAEAVL
jgi:NADPH:quinone reductase-like Zn-dependent oxidoreductase